jgi:hypothetical protein
MFHTNFSITQNTKFNPNPSMGDQTGTQMDLKNVSTPQKDDYYYFPFY